MTVPFLLTLIKLYSVVHFVVTIINFTSSRQRVNGSLAPRNKSTQNEVLPKEARRKTKFWKKEPRARRMTNNVVVEEGTLPRKY